MQSLIKPVSAGLLFAIWGVMVALGKAPSEAFIDAIQFALVSLGVYHASQAGSYAFLSTTQATPAPVEAAAVALPVVAPKAVAQTPPAAPIAPVQAPSVAVATPS